jgi:uncharacterized repeat protein (TIGR03803 family)
MRKATSFLIALLVFLAFPIILAQAQTLTVLYNFTGGADGAYPWAGLIRDKDGNLYGTTTAGGPSNAGTVFKLDTAGKETVLHSFTYSDGAGPLAGLVRDKVGNFYGTAYQGGSYGDGTVFKLDTAGKETVLHSFTYSDGAGLWSGLVMDKAGNLYGTAVEGGSYGYGTVFKLDRTGNETVLYNFTGGADGAYPEAALVRDKDGNLYSTTSLGGPYGYGTVFKLDTAGKETVLHSFTYSDGAVLYAGLIRDKEGNLYGTANQGSYGYGTVFKLDRTGNEAVLHNFTNTPDGANPFAGLIRDKEGNRYGTTTGGGSYGYGTVFKLDTTGKETVLYGFSGGTDGNSPFAGLIRDKEGNLYGTTFLGGSYGYGTVFKLTLNCEEMHHCEGHSGQ